ncbi:pyridoxamine 5'-phosphate oxidase family protein [Massilia phyllosphaerae]|uniref:pyridoxamine 5'-phosphate oxidase family protein n=1 Tax=Massilia phyllosphaerae TaxID=3106034 RepID=UPI002B1CD57B|nr:pyridoxamine 5'-phosphate oxidase family protein [Massilia sp. SGZ-792]
MTPSRFHAGELQVQARAGVPADYTQRASAAIRDHMPDQHRQFFSQLPLFFLGALDADGQPWATVLAGEPGFIMAPDARTLRIGGGLLPGDPLQGHLLPGRRVGGLGLVPATRRRNRVNGVIDAVDGGVVTVAVEQSFGNCPQYIQQRAPHAVTPPAAPLVVRAAALDDRDLALIGRADTLFIASANPDIHSAARADAQAAAQADTARGVDVSHRGGRPGFVHADAGGTLLVPDFMGNSFFNTLGNLALYPRAGLLFVDFDSGDLLHLAVEGEIVWDGPLVAAFEGAERLLRLRVREVVRNVAALPLRWSAAQPAAQLARTGDWHAVAQELKREKGHKLSLATL